MSVVVVTDENAVTDPAMKALEVKMSELSFMMAFETLRLETVTNKDGQIHALDARCAARSESAARRS